MITFVNGNTIGYDDVGHGIPVLFLHGARTTVRSGRCRWARSPRPRALSAWTCGFSRKSDNVLCTAVTAPLFAPSPPS